MQKYYKGGLEGSTSVERKGREESRIRQKPTLWEALKLGWVFPVFLTRNVVWEGHLFSKCVLYFFEGDIDLFQNPGGLCCGSFIRNFHKFSMVCFPTLINPVS